MNIFADCLNTKQQGNQGLGQAIAYFCSIGWTVSVPLNDSQNYDLIVDDGTQLHKVQVKTTNEKAPSGNYKVDLRTTGGNQSFHTVKHFDKNKVDWLFVLTSENTMYCIPSEKTNKSTITIKRRDNEYKILMGCVPHGGL